MPCVRSCLCNSGSFRNAGKHWAASEGDVTLRSGGIAYKRSDFLHAILSNLKSASFASPCDVMRLLVRSGFVGGYSFEHGAENLCSALEGITAQGRVEDPAVKRAVTAGSCGSE